MDMENRTIPDEHSPLSRFYLEKLAQTKPLLSYRTDRPFAPQQAEIRAKLLSLLRMPEKTAEPIPEIEYVRREDPRFDEIRFTFAPEPGLRTPAHLLLPKGAERGVPVMICLQGHSKGMHVSLGRAGIRSLESAPVEGDRDFALQAAARGYAAIAMEQRGFGELAGDISLEKGCAAPYVQALALGRTLLGERVFDVMRLIDLLPRFPQLDPSRVYVMGNSGGGTVSYFALCADERLRGAIASCFFGEYLHSWFSRRHCVCGFLPDFCRWFDLPDLAAAAAPRPLVLVAGEHDPLTDIAHVRSSFAEKVQPIYRAAGAPDACRLTVGPEGHRFYAQPAWESFGRLVG